MENESAALKEECRSGNLAFCGGTTGKPGKLYGVGVGPGDPELMTLKAVRIIEECDVAAVPAEIPQESVAYRIAAQACPRLAEKELAGIPMPMTRNPAKLSASHERGAGILKDYLDAGKQVAFLTLGDPAVYSTYLYLQERLRREGYLAEMVSGVTSFCAAAARLGTGLAAGTEGIHVISDIDCLENSVKDFPDDSAKDSLENSVKNFAEDSPKTSLEDALRLPGTKVFMKAGRRAGTLREAAQRLGLRAMMAENCGMPGERLYLSAEEMPERGSYYSVVIVKE